MAENRFYKLADASRLTGIGKQTLQNYAKTERIRSITTPTGRRTYDISTLIAQTETSSVSKEVCYCRVSTNGQRPDLARQIEYMEEKYPEYEIVSDVGSGINFKRPGLQKIIKYAIEGTLKTLVIAYKDRLCRIGYDLIEHILETYSETDIIIDSPTEETINDEIANDIIQIITVYSAKINGMRSYKTKE